MCTRQLPHLDHVALAGGPEIIQKSKGWTLTTQVAGYYRMAKLG